MALQLYVKLQTPTIELKVEGKDASGAKNSLLVGFKRYEQTEAESEISKFQECLNASAELGSLTTQELDAFMKDQVVYIKKAELETVDSETGNMKELKVPDTRTAKPIEAFWASSDECLAVLLDMYLASQPWKASFISSVQKALLNNDYEEALAGNLRKQGSC